MPPIESINGASASRLAMSALPTPTARSGADKALAAQSARTSLAAAPIQSTRAVVQAQAQEATRLNTAAPPASSRSAPVASSPTQSLAQSLAQPMTAALLHELRLQQELADLREELGGETGGYASPPTAAR